MANEFYTLIVIPHAKARFRRIQVPVRLAKRALVVAGLGALSLAAVLIHYAFINVQAFEVRRLRAENESLAARTLKYREATDALRARVGQLQGMVTKLGVMAGLEKSLPDPTIAGVGGALSSEAPPPLDFKGSLAAIDDTVKVLSERSSRLAAFYADQKVLLASTPSVWPVRGYLSTAFGNRLDPFTGQPDFHSGIDISTPVGTPVRAPADAVVIFTGVKGAYGNAVILNHGFGTVTQYGHLDRFEVRSGQRVHRGDVIAYVGNTGRSTGPHLHYEVWVHDQAQNPLTYILDDYRNLG